MVIFSSSRPPDAHEQLSSPRDVVMARSSDCVGLRLDQNAKTTAIGARSRRHSVTTCAVPSVLRCDPRRRAVLPRSPPSAVWLASSCCVVAVDASSLACLCSACAAALAAGAHRGPVRTGRFGLQHQWHPCVRAARLPPMLPPLSASCMRATGCSRWSSCAAPLLAGPSDIAGPALALLDRTMRTLGSPAARSGGQYPHCPPRPRPMLEAYARGVVSPGSPNVAGSARRSSVPRHPEPWEPVDSLLWGETMGLWLSLELADRTVAPVRSPGKCRSKDRRTWPSAERRRSPAARSAPVLRHAASELAPTGAARGFPDPYTLPNYGIERMGGGWPPQRYRCAAACGRSAPGVPLAFPPSGTWRGSRHLTASWPVPPLRRAPASWYSATTVTLPGASRPPAPTCGMFIETPVGDSRYSDP